MTKQAETAEFLKISRTADSLRKYSRLSSAPFLASLAVVLSVSAMVLAVGSLNRAQANSSSPSLYQRIGGRQTISAVVGDFVDSTMRDSRIRINSRTTDYMKHCKPAEVKLRLYGIICEASGGPCKAAKQKAEMAKAMAAMDFSETDWKAMKDDFTASLNKFNILPTEQEELQEILDQARVRSVDLTE